MRAVRPQTAPTTLAALRPYQFQLHKTKLDKEIHRKVRPQTFAALPSVGVFDTLSSLHYGLYCTEPHQLGLVGLGVVWYDSISLEEIGVMSMFDQFLDRATVAKMLHVEPWTIWSWSKRGTFPKPIRMGRLVRYQASQVAAWIEERKRAGA